MASAVSPLTISLIIVTVMMSPAWLQHLFAKNAGFDMMLSMSEDEVEALPAVAFHLAGVIGTCAFYACFLAIAASHTGDARVKQAVTAIFCTWPVVLIWNLYNRPAQGTPPESFFAMPVPLLLVMGVVPAIGFVMDSKPSDKSKEN